MGSRQDGPDALHIGFSKCASTFLQAFFEEHPDVFLVNQSHYLAPFDLSAYPEDQQGYIGRFGSAGENQVRLESDEHILLPLFHPTLGAAATTLESVAEVASRIYSIQPDAKIVFVIRNQTSLLVSRYSEYILCGGTREFHEFVSEFLRDSTDGTNYFQNFYEKIYAVFAEKFGSDNVLQILQEDLARNESAVIQSISDFLGVNAFRPSDRGLVSRRVGLSRLGISIVRSMNKLLVKRQKQSFNEAQVRVPFVLYKIIQRTLRVIDFYMPAVVKGDKNAILNRALKDQIRDVFREDNTALANRLGRDLAPLGY